MEPDSGAIAIRIAIIFILLGLSAFFSSSETALTTVNKIRIRTLADNGNKQALWVMRLLENRSKMLSAILIGNNVVNLSASSMLTVLVTEIFGNKAAGAATGILTLLILIFGEITPKTIATLEAEKNALRFAHTIYVIMTFLTPVIFLVERMSGGVLKLIRVNTEGSGEELTEDELRTIVEVGHEKGVIETGEKEIINNVFDLGDAVARDIMVPRIDMVFISIDAGYHELMDVFCRERYTRLPVYQDNTDNVVGIINIKDVLLAGGHEQFSIREHLRQPIYTFEAKKVSELMVEMRKTSNNIVIVLDEYGATAGLITLEDILEEIVGDIRDEYDEDEEEDFVALGNGEYLVEGSMKLDDLNDLLHLNLTSEDYDSLGGLVIGCLDHLPGPGEAVELEGVRLVVETVEKNRIGKIHLYLERDLDEK